MGKINCVELKADTIEKTINELKYMAVENIHTEGKRLKKMKGASVTCETISREHYQTFKE